MQSIKKYLTSMALILLSFVTIFLFSACGEKEITLKGVRAENGYVVITYSDDFSYKNFDILGLKLRYSDGSEQDLDIEKLIEEGADNFSYSIKKMREVEFGEPVYETYNDINNFGAGNYEIIVNYENYSVTVYLNIAPNEEEHAPATVSFSGDSTTITYGGNMLEPVLSYDGKEFDYDASDLNDNDVISYRFLYTTQDSEDEYWSWSEYDYSTNSTCEDSVGSYKLVAQLTTANHGIFYSNVINFTVTEADLNANDFKMYVESYDWQNGGYNYTEIDSNTTNEFEYSFQAQKLSDYLGNFYIVNAEGITILANENILNYGAYNLSANNPENFEFISVSSSGQNNLTINSNVIAQSGNDNNYCDYTITFKFTLSENYNPISKTFNIRIKKLEVEVLSLMEGIQFEYDGTAKTPDEISSSFKLLPTTDGKVFEEVNGNYELVYDYDDNRKTYIPQNNKHLELGKTYYQQNGNNYVEATLGFFGYEFYSVWNEQTQVSTEYLIKIYSITNAIQTNAGEYDVSVELLNSVSNRVILKKLVPTEYSAVDANHHNEDNYFICSGSYYDDITADISYNEGEGDQTTTIFKYYVYEKVNETTYEKTSDDAINWNKTYYLYEGSEYVVATFYYISQPAYYSVNSSFNIGSWKVIPKAYNLTYDVTVNSNPISNFYDNGGNFVLTYNHAYTFSIANLNAYFETKDTAIDWTKTYYLYDGTPVTIYYLSDENNNIFTLTPQAVDNISTYYAKVGDNYYEIRPLTNGNYICIVQEETEFNSSSMTLYEKDDNVSLSDPLILTLTILDANDQVVVNPTGININGTTLTIGNTTDFDYFRIKLEFNLNSPNYESGAYTIYAYLMPTAVATQATITIRNYEQSYNANYGGYVGTTQAVQNVTDYYIYENDEYILLTSQNIPTLLYENNTLTQDTSINWNKTYYLDAQNNYQARFYYYDATKLVCEYGTELYQDNYVYYDGQEKTVDAEMMITDLDSYLTLFAIQQKNGQNEWETVAEGQNASVSEAGEYRAVFSYNYYTTQNVGGDTIYTYYMLIDAQGNYLHYIYCEFEIKQGTAVTLSNYLFNFRDHNSSVLTPTDNTITINSGDSVNFEVQLTYDSNSQYNGQYIIIYEYATYENWGSYSHGNTIYNAEAGTYYLRARIILEPGNYLVYNDETVIELYSTITVQVQTNS